MIYRDSTILNNIRNYVSNSMQNEIFTNAQLAVLDNSNLELNSFNEDNMKYITCGVSICGSDSKINLQFVGRE